MNQFSPTRSVVSANNTFDRVLDHYLAELQKFDRVSAELHYLIGWHSEDGAIPVDKIRAALAGGES
jgi:hypothetical protein